MLRLPRFLYLMIKGRPINMGKFNYLDTMRVSDTDTSECTLYAVVLPNGKNPVFIGRHAGETNKPYINAILQGSTKTRKMVQANLITAGMLAENRDQDRALFPLHVITGWRDVCDASGVDVEFTRDECAEFIAALPDDQFDELRNHFASPSNFRNVVSPEDAIAKGKK